jgi:hypothetical protein
MDGHSLTNTEGLYMTLDKVTSRQGRSISWLCRTKDELFVINKLSSQSYRVEDGRLILSTFPTLEKALEAIEKLIS